MRYCFSTASEPSLLLIGAVFPFVMRDTTYFTSAVKTTLKIIFAAVSTIEKIISMLSPGLHGRAVRRQADDQPPLT